nr:zinc-finger domain-containing protein [Wenxinia saemankumensis]
MKTDSPNAPPPPEVTVTDQWRVACDGSGPGLGHPRVWLSIPADRGWVECGYCDRRFVHETHAEDLGHARRGSDDDLPGRTGKPGAHPGIP